MPSMVSSFPLLLEYASVADISTARLIGFHLSSKLGNASHQTTKSRRHLTYCINFLNFQDIHMARLGSIVAAVPHHATSSAIALRHSSSSSRSCTLPRS